MRNLDWTVLTIMVIGAINWGLVGLFNFDFFSAIFGSGLFSRCIFTIIGIAGLYGITLYGRMDSDRSAREANIHR